MKAELRAIELLARLLKGDDKRFAAEVLGGLNHPAVADLIGIGGLAPDGLLEETICDACDQLHGVAVVSGDRTGWWCPSAGFVPVATERLAALSFSVEAVASKICHALRNAFGPSTGSARPVAGSRSWVLGDWQIANRVVTVLLALEPRRVSEARFTATELERLPRRDLAVAISVGDETGFPLPSYFAFVPFETAVDIHDGRLLVRPLSLQAAVARSGLGSKAKRGRRNWEQAVVAVSDQLVRDRQIKPEDIHPSDILKAWQNFHGNEPPPKPSTIRGHLATWREGLTAAKR